MKFFNFGNAKIKQPTFYPLDLKGYGNAAASYNTLENDFALIDSFYNLPEVYIPINYLATKIAALKFDLLDNDRKVEKHQILDLIQYPNNFDSFEELVKKFFIYKYITGNAYLNAVNVAGYAKISKIVNLAPQYTTIKLTANKDFRLQEVKSYHFDWNGQQTIIDPLLVLHFKDTNLKMQEQFYVYGKSRLLSAKYNLTSLEAGYSTRCSLYQHGARHILTGSGNEFNMLTPEQSKTEQIRINNEFGLTERQHQIMVTRFPMNVTTLSKGVNELQLNEMNLADFQKICALYEVPTILLNDNIQSTFNNKAQAEMDFYINTVIPQAQEFYENFVWWISNLLGEKKKYNIQLITENIKSLQANEVENTQKVIAQLNAGIITQPEARKLLNYETII